MQPIPETAEAINELDPSVDDGRLLARLTSLANRAREVVPDLVGVSVASIDEGLTFTLVATDEEIALLDAIQYAAGGPCVDGALNGAFGEFDDQGLLDEEGWRLFAEATAATAVRSTLTLPLVTGGQVSGSVNLYGGSRRAFVGHEDELARIFGAWAGGAVANADLSFLTRRSAEQAPERIRQTMVIDQAVGILAAQLDLDVESAEDRLRDAATRAGVSMADVARRIVRSQDRDDPDDA